MIHESHSDAVGLAAPMCTSSAVREILHVGASLFARNAAGVAAESALAPYCDSGNVLRDTARNSCNCMLILELELAVILYRRFAHPAAALGLTRSTLYTKSHWAHPAFV